MNVFRADAIANFQNQEYREAAWEEFLNIWIASQIRVLREQRGLTQATLADKAGMKQSRISAFESGDYSSWSVSTLKRLANAFGVTLAIEFRGYGKRLIDFDRFERHDLQEPDFSQDSFFKLPEMRQTDISSPNQSRRAGVLRAALGQEFPSRDAPTQTVRGGNIIGAALTRALSPEKALA